ncbi:MAG: lipid-A-disaccharide synthase [Leptospiraceae bacterium]|nr:lipid-A-disaccharide synthase [Leptospiraceae bacterium]MDW7976046.1 lipid-A-disaccharide synthase [Leptospiraceae bacterium]
MKKSTKIKDKKILIITGEHSGELLALDIVKELKQVGDFQFWGTGGDLLQKEGVRLIEHIKNMAVIGIIEAIKAYRFLKNLLSRILDIIREQQIQYVILVDYPGFNLRLAKAIKKTLPEVFIFYFVSPQIWAWNYKRIKIIKETIQKIYVLFSFEEEIYKREGINVLWVGHPLKFRIPQALRKQKPIKIIDKPVIGFLPGSRLSEVRGLLIPMLKSALLLKERYPQATFLLSSVESKGLIYDYIQEQLKDFKELKILVVPEASLRIMKESDVLVIASGTATLEAAYFHKPMVICYKIHWLNYLIFSFLVKTKYIGLPNLLAKEEVALELLQNEASPENIYSEVVKILENESYRKKIVNLLKQIQFVPKNQQPAKIFSEDILQFLQ